MTSVSLNNQIFSFSVKESADFFDATFFRRVPIILGFGNVTMKEKTLLMKSTVHYYAQPVEDGNNCEVDRFYCYPL